MNLIGKGNFGKVKLVYNTDENNKAYAMKSIPKKKKIKGLIGGKLTSELDDIMNEIAIMKKLVSLLNRLLCRIMKISCAFMKFLTIQSVTSFILSWNMLSMDLSHRYLLRKTPLK